MWKIWVNYEPAYSQPWQYWDQSASNSFFPATLGCSRNIVFFGRKPRHFFYNGCRTEIWSKPIKTDLFFWDLLATVRPLSFAWAVRKAVTYAILQETVKSTLFAVSRKICMKYEENPRIKKSETAKLTKKQQKKPHFAKFINSWNKFATN